MFKPTKRREELLWQINIIVYRRAGTRAGGAVIKRQGVA